MSDVLNIDVPNIGQLSYAANREYMSRPADQRFETIDALKAAVDARRMVSFETMADVTDMEFVPSPEGGIYVASKKLPAPALPTHYSFGQAAALVKAPAAYLRTLPNDLAAKALNYGVSQRDAESIKLLSFDDDALDRTRVQAFTSQTYGRIWDADVVAAAQKIVGADPRWTNPLEWSGKRGGLYASDRDCFMFFIDGGSMVDGGSDRDQLNRGFFMWNSEVGNATFGIASFLFRVVCGNHIIHNMEGVKLLRIRHTSGGPERFINEAIPALQEYVAASAKPLEETVKRAKLFLLPKEENDFSQFFLTKGFSKGEVRRAKAMADQMEGQSAFLWDMVNGFTAIARELAFVDARNDLDKRAGKLLDLVKA